LKSLEIISLGNPYFIASAFISGMEEELHVAGIEYNWMGVLFMMGYLS
jgi:ACS family pantothenate transporter-like MFS transporter